ncbi:MAG: hypothetical protein K5866_02120 [Treponema sp.]|nr:hypothetical protein [Treponema sp.]
MKKSFVFLLSLVFILIFSCKSNVPTEESIPDYQLDLSKITLWGISDQDDRPCGTYDKSSHVLEINYQYRGAQIYFGDFDASAYKYLCIEYQDSSLPYKFYVT